MFSLKRGMAAMALLGVVLLSASPAAAVLAVSDIEITISNLGAFNLAAFDLDLSYDDAQLTFVDYTLTGELGALDGFDADDWSFGDDGFGTVNLNVVSYLPWGDPFFDTQADDFTLATVSFEVTGDPSALDGVLLSYVDLSDDFGDPIPFAVNGTDINAVPVPGALWLLGSGLVGVVGLRRRNRG